MICIAGKNEIAVSALLYLIKRGWRDQILVCPNRSDTGVSTWQPSLIRFAKEFNIPVLPLDQIQEIEDLIFISLEFDRLVNPQKFRTDYLYNIHFSALPEFKGMYTSALPILMGKTISGVTLHEIDSGIDTGPIIGQVIFDLPEDCTARDLYFLYLSYSKEIFEEYIESLASSKKPISAPQSAKGSTYFSKKSINYDNIKINTQDTADGIVKQLRALSFREYQIPKIDDISIGRWAITGKRSESPIGKLIPSSDDLFLLPTIDYDLHVWRDHSADWFDWLERKTNLTTKDLDVSFLDDRDKDGWTPLIRAAYLGDFRRCQILLELGADPNKTNLNGTTPLMYACSAPDSERGRMVSEELLRFGANIESRDRFGKTIFDYHPYLLREAWVGS